MRVTIPPRIVANDKGISVSALAPFDIPADGRVRRVVKLTVGDVAGDTEFVVAANAGPYSDTVTRPLRVVPRGFPVEIGEGANIGAGSTISKSAPAGKLTLERTRQKTIDGWTRPVKKS